MNWKPKPLLIALMLPLAAVAAMAQKDADSTAQAILAQMTLRQKVHELHGRGVVKFGVRKCPRKSPDERQKPCP